MRDQSVNFGHNAEGVPTAKESCCHKTPSIPIYLLYEAAYIFFKFTFKKKKGRKINAKFWVFVARAIPLHGFHELTENKDGFIYLIKR